jgi:hypothetical protein
MWLWVSVGQLQEGQFGVAVLSIRRRVSRLVAIRIQTLVSAFGE